MNGLNLRAWRGLTKTRPSALWTASGEGDKWLPFSHPAAINRRLQMNSHVRPLSLDRLTFSILTLLPPSIRFCSSFSGLDYRLRGKGGTNPVRKDRNSMVDCALNHFKGGVRNGGIRGSLSSSQPARSFWCLHLRNERLFLTLPLSRSFESRRKERSLASCNLHSPPSILDFGHFPTFLPRICINKLVIRGGT